MTVADLYGRQPSTADGGWAWVLTVHYAGVAYRWSSRPLDHPPSADGVELQIDPGLNAGVMVHESLPLSGRDNRQAMSFDVYMPPDTNVATLVGQGHRLAGCPAEVALMPSGGEWGDRHVVHAGVISKPVYGDDDEPLSFTVVGREERVEPAYPAASKRVSVETWPDALEGAMGLPYPEVRGQPGVYIDEDGTSTPAAATPAIVVEYSYSGSANQADTLLICDGAVSADSIILWYASETANGGWSRTTAATSITTDGLGQTVTVVDVSGEPAVLREAGSYYAEWLFGPGLPVEGAPEDYLGAGAHALMWLVRAGVDVSVPRSLQAGALLDDYRFDGMIDEPTTPHDWLADRVLGTLPVYLGYAADGEYLAPIHWQADARDAVAHLEVGAGSVVRVDRIQIVSDGDATEVRVRWAPDLRSNEYRQTTTLTTDPILSTAVDASATTTSARQAPVRSVEVELPDCWDRATAQLVAEYTAWREGSERHEIPLEVDADTWTWLQRGDVVLVTDASVGWDEAVCLVSSIGRGDAPWVLLSAMRVRW